MALLAAKPMVLDGVTLGAGEEIPPAHWAAQRERTRRALTRTRMVRSTDLQPVARTDSPPVASTTPLRADGPSRRGRTRKAG